LSTSRIFYLLNGAARSFADLILKYNAEYGLIPEQDNEAIIFPVHDGKAVCFKFRKLYTLKYKDIKVKRVGRLLPPFLTRLQQRYSAYLQRPGLSRLPSVAFPSPAAAPTVPAIETVAAVETVVAPALPPEVAKEPVAAAPEAPPAAAPEKAPDQSAG
jgi:hypothetical protein